jgi:hypothetical protein
MLKRSKSQLSCHGCGMVAFLLAVATLTVLCQPTSALIIGGEGNEPIRDPGWPTGAAAIFNHPARVAWWEGPPFGGGQYHAECRGDSKTFNKVLAQFARLDVKNKRVILCDGEGHSFWLNPNREPDRKLDTRIDWVFMVWVSGNWDRFRGAPPSLNPTDPKDAGSGPPATIEVFTKGNVHWSELDIPKGITIIDNRLESHGFTPADGSVIEGTVLDTVTESPIAAHVRLEQAEAAIKEKRTYKVVSKLVANAKGHWVLNNVPPGTNRIVVEADGYVPKIVGYFQFGKQPKWQSFNGGLSRATTVTGRVTDSNDQPLADVDVELHDVTSAPGGRYQSPFGYSTKTGADGKFHLDNVPVGTASLHLRKSGFCRPGLSPSISTPAKDVALRMTKSARLVVAVDFTAADRPETYIVSIEQEGGPAVGKWGGSAQIDAKNRRVFENVPPGTYVIHGHPNPTTDGQRTDPVTVELEGGKTSHVSLLAR